jgi:hypothetical protein
MEFTNAHPQRANLPDLRVMGKIILLGINHMPPVKFFKCLDLDPIS